MKLLMSFSILVCTNLVAHSQTSGTIYIPYNSCHKWGFADTAGRMLIKPVFDSVGLFYNGYATAYKKQKVGLINRKGKWVVLPEYDFAEVLNKESRLFKVTIDKSIGDDYTSYDGIYKEGVGLITPIKYATVRQYNSYKYALEGYGKNYILDLRTNKITVFNHKDYFDCGCGRYYEKMLRQEQKVRKQKERARKYLSGKPPLEEIGEINYFHVNGKMGGYIVYDTLFDKMRHRWIKYIDTIAAVYDTIVPVDSEGKYFMVQYAGNWGVVNAKGKTVIQPEYSVINLAKIRVTSQKNFVVKKNGKSGVISYIGTIILPCVYDSILVTCGYMKCFFTAQKNGKWALANNRGIVVTDFISDSAIMLNYWADAYRCTIIAQHGKFGIIDTTGKLIHPVVYDTIDIKDNGFMIIRKGKLFGLKKIGEPMIGLEAEWDTVRLKYPGYFAIKKDNLHGIYDPGKKSNERSLYFPLSDDPDFDIERCYSENEKFEYTIFAFEKNDLFYYVGENGIKYVDCL